MNIDNLSKVTVSIEINGNGPTCFDYIFGISSSGLSSFELDLYKKSAGDTLTISIPGTTAPEYFGHLFRHVYQLVNLPVVPQTCDARITIVTVEPSEERDVIKAMAQSLGHSCGGGGCDCGCS